MGAGHEDPVTPVLLGISIILLAAKFGGDLMVRVRQPAVLGELLVGVVLGNLVLGGFEGLEFLRPGGVDGNAGHAAVGSLAAQTLDMLARIGVILLLFEVGLESNLHEMRKVGLSSLLVAVLGVVTPMGLGWLASRWLLPDQSWHMHLFIGATLCATSVGITARVLKDLGKTDTSESKIILGAAVIDDVMGLVVLAVVQAIIVQGTASPLEVAIIIGKALGFLVGAVVLGEWLSPRLFGIAAKLRVHGMLVITGLVFCFLLSWTASLVGLAPIVGAFAAGLILDEKHYERLRASDERSLEDWVLPITTLLVPIFFVMMGFQVDLRVAAVARAAGDSAQGRTRHDPKCLLSVVRKPAVDSVASVKRESGGDRVARGLVLAILGVFAVAGLSALGYRLDRGLGVTRLGSVVPWGVWGAFYIYFIGLSAGSFLLSTLIFVFKNEKLEPVGRLPVLQAFVCLVTGMVFILIDLGHWERFWHVFVYPQWNSVLAWEIWFYNFYIVVLLAELWLLMRCDLSRWAGEARGAWSRFYRVLSFGSRCPTTDEELRGYTARTSRWLAFFGIIGIPVALGVHGGTGAIFAVVKARPAWYSPIFPLVFIISALASGGGLLLFLRAFVTPRLDQDRHVLPMLAKLTGGFLIVDLLLLFLEFLTGYYGGIPDHVEPYSLMAFGPFWWVFWIQQLLLGAAVPLAMIFVRPERAGPRRVGIAGLLIVAGIFGVRLNIVIPPLAVPVFRGFDHAIDTPRLASLYVPNWIEWLSSLGIIAAAALAAYGAMRLLPMNEHEPYPGRA